MPSEIMEWIPDEDYEKKNADRLTLEKQIAELQEKLQRI